MVVSFVATCFFSRSFGMACCFPKLIIQLCELLVCIVYIYLASNGSELDLQKRNLVECSAFQGDLSKYIIYVQLIVIALRVNSR